MDLKILLVEPSYTIQDVLLKNIDREFGAKVVTFKGAEAAADLLKVEYFDLILVRNFAAETVDKPRENLATNLLNAVYDMSITTPVIVLGELETTHKNIMIFDSMRIEDLNRMILKSLNKKKSDFQHVNLPDYVAFPVKYFYLMTLFPCDVYIKINKKESIEYVKRLHFGESFTKEDLQKYEVLGLAEFYIRKEERELFLNGLLTQSITNLRASHPIANAIVLTGDSFAISADLIKSLGISTMSVALVDQTIHQIKNQIVKSEKLAALLKRFFDNVLGYSYRRSYLICLIGYTLLPKMEWGSAEQLISLMDKISLISFFHDIYLEDEVLLKIMTLEQLNAAKLTSRQRDSVMNHANKAALISQSYPKLPQGVDIIIKQHHGVSNGVGFPETITTAGISPMAVFFVVIEDFVTQLLEHNDYKRLPDIMKNLKERYQLPTYRKIVTELDKMIQKN